MVQVVMKRSEHYYVIKLVVDNLNLITLPTTNLQSIKAFLQSTAQICNSCN